MLCAAFRSVVATVLVLTSMALHAATAPGTALLNQAELRYFDPLNGQVLRVLSNTSRVMVGESVAFALDDDKTRLVSPGQTVNIEHALINTGNVIDSYSLVLANLAGDAGDLQGLSVYLDINGNGLADAGEAAVTELTQIQPGETVALVVSGAVPASLQQGQEIRLSLEATSQRDSSQIDVVTDTVLVADGASLVLSKSSSQSCDVPLAEGATLEYQLSITNAGNSSPQERLIQVAGQPEQGVLIEDLLPGNVTLVAGSVSAVAPLQALPVLHFSGDAQDVWQPYDSWNGMGAVEKIGLLIPASGIRNNQTGNFNFQVRVNSGLTQGTVLFNQARVDLDGNGFINGDDVESNRVCNQVAATLTPEITFQRPANHVYQQNRAPHHSDDADFVDAVIYPLVPEESQRILLDGAYLRVTASQLNQVLADEDFVQTTPSGERLLQVSLLSRLTGDTVRMAVRETGVNTGVFRSVFPLSLNEDRLGAGGLCPAGANAQSLAQYSDSTTLSDVLGLGCVLQSGPQDRITATFSVPTYAADGSVVNVQTVTALAAVDPAGTVFDVSNGRPVPGAVVAMYQSRQPFAVTGAASCAALPESAYERALHPFTGVVLDDEHTDTATADNTLQVGRYQFPLATPGHCYYLDVVPPAGYTFPSSRPPAAAKAFYPNISESSYGLGGYDPTTAPLGRAAARAASADNNGAFLLGGTDVFVDIPLDPSSTTTAGILLLDKQVETDQAAVGDVLAYQIDLTSNHDADLFAAEIVDRLPYGFRYIENSAWLEIGERRIEMPEPANNGSNQLTFAVRQQTSAGPQPLPIAPGSTVTLHYGLRLSAGAVDSDGINRAVASANTGSGFTYYSNQDEVQVKVRNEGVLSDQAMVFGKVYVDADCNNLQNDGEYPVGGVKLYLSDGSWVITDENGQYTLYGLRPGLHTIKVDPLTLPEGLKLKPIDNRHAADPQSRFLDLTPGEYHRADFAAMCPTAEQRDALVKNLQARNASLSGDWMLDEAARFDPLRENNSNNRLRQADGSGDLGSGVYTQTGDANLTEVWEQVGRSQQGEQSLSVVGAEPERKMVETKIAAENVTHEQGQSGTWLWPLEGVSRDGRLQVAVRGGVEPDLYVNDEKVSRSQLGEQILNRREKTQVLSWYGVPLQEGDNKVEVKTQDMFGNERVLASTTLLRPAAARSLMLEPAAQTLPADGGRSTLAIRVKMLDGRGNPARGTYFVTLENDKGAWLEEDLQPDTAGYQIRVRDGEGVAHLRSTEYTGPVRLRATVDEFAAKATVEQIAPLRPLVATGYVQLKQGFGGNLRDNGNAPTELGDSLPEEGLDANGAVFVKGAVRGNAHLTLAYDTDNDLDDDEEIRRDLNPSDSYPIAGDASVRGYDARSRSKLYAKLEKDRSSIMWGDYLTDPNYEVQDLGRIQRTLTGLNGIYESDRARFQVFGARPEYEQVSEEIRGNGTALLFTLSSRPERDSETLELIIRDRDNPGLVISVQPLTRYVDYSVNYFTGDIRFHDVIPTVDENLNPVYIRASYNVEASDAEEYTVMGARARYQLNERLSVSASRTRDEHDVEGFDLRSVAAEYALSERNRLYVSSATMENNDDDSEGRAFSFGSQWIWQNGSQTDLRWARAEAGFRNPAAGIVEERQEMRLNHEQKLTDTVSADLEAIHSESLDTEEAQGSVAVRGRKQLGSTQLEAGVRGIEQTDENGNDEEFGTWIVGANQAASLFGKPLTLGAEYEQAFADTERRRIAADADLGITEKTSLYSRYEMINSLSGINLLDNSTETRQFTFGVRSALTRNTDVFSEYRLRGAQDGRDVAAANGVRSDIEIEPGLTISPSAEWIETLDGNTSQDSTALSLAAEDRRNPNRRTLGRAETRFGDERTYYGLSAANIWRMNVDWSAVVRDDLRLQYFDAQAKQGDNIVTLGAARRPRLDNRHHMLFMYKWKTQWGGDSGADRRVHIVSTHHNYQPHDDWIFSGRLGGKWQTTELYELDVDTDAYVADGRIIWDMTRRFDLDVHAGALTTEGVEERRYSFGVGVNALIRRNLRMGVGYNFTGFRDDDLDPEGYNVEGLYVGLEYKFDEDDLGWLGSKAAGQRSYMGEAR
ncbi:hypothetical protein [Alcanivorax sp.]|uniref:hypothetical protein n=1 Tax=Alcanivorax sp. TaxID=1872427 RepID=UPI0025C2B408|nr:hypothetical protein [Alcanivorax sp.]